MNAPLKTMILVLLITSIGIFNSCYTVVKFSSDEQKASEESFQDKIPRQPTLVSPPLSTTEEIIHLTGYADPDIWIEIVGGVEIAQVQTDAQGGFSAEVILVPDQINDLKITAYNNNGQASESIFIQIQQNMVPSSQANLVAPAPGTFAVTSAAVASGVEFQVDLQERMATTEPRANIDSDAVNQTRVQTRAQAASSQQQTALVQIETSNFQFDVQNNIFSFDAALTNISTEIILNPMKVIIENMRPRAPDVTIVNADGGGITNGAFWQYDTLVGADQILTPSETSLTRNWQFRVSQLMLFSFTVRFDVNPNDAPQFVSVPDTTANTNEIYLYAADVVDADNDSLIYSLLNGPAGMTMDSLEGFILWQPDESQLGVHPVEIRADDPYGKSDTQQFMVAVNRPPEITSLPVTSAAGGIPHAYQVEATDPDSDPITYALAEGPDGMTIDSLSGLISWDPDVVPETPSHVLSVYETEPDIVVASPSYYFGDVTVGDSSAAHIMITNQGVADLVVTALTIGGEQPAQFAAEGPDSVFTIPALGSEILSVAFLPDSLGLQKADLTLLSNDPDEATTLIPLAGTGVSLPQPDILVTPPAVDIQTTLLGSSSTAFFVIRNHGSTALMVTDISVENDPEGNFTLIADETAFSLNPLDARQVAVAFQPATEGLKAALLQVISSDPGSDTVQVALTAIAAAENCYPDSLQLQLASGESSTQRLSVTIPSCQEVSSFGTDNEGWTVHQDGQPDPVLTAQQISGGNPGGYLTATLDGSLGPWYWHAPPQFLGDQSGAYGLELEFDLRQPSLASQFDDEDIILSGGGLTLVYSTANNPGTSWTSYAVELTESAGWTKNDLNGSPPTQGEMMTVLTFLDSIKIRGQYSTNENSGDLDNVTMPCPAEALLKVDVFFIVDRSSGFDEELALFKTQAANILDDLEGMGLNTYVGLAGFEDYRDASFTTLKPYERVLDLVPIGQDSDNNNMTDILEAINSLQENQGGDLRDSNLPAVYQAATGEGQDLSFIAGDPSIAPNQGVSFRDGSMRLFVLCTDAVFHEPSDVNYTFAIFNALPYPGPSFSETVAALNAKNIQLIGIIGDDANDQFAFADLEALVKGTDTFAPAGGIDCDGDGIVDILEGEPILCSVSNNGPDIGKAVPAVVRAAALQAELILEVIDDPNTAFDESTLVAAASPARFANVDITSGGLFDFDVTFTCPRDAPPRSSFQLNALLDGAVFCTFDVQLDCRDVQNINVAVVARDEYGFDSQEYLLEVTPNTSPEITSRPLTVASVGNAYRYDVIANDIDEDMMQYQLLISPAGMTINTQSGRIDWTPGQAGTETVEVNVSDGRGGNTIQRYTVSATPDVPPRVIAMSPAPDSTVVEATEIVITFSEPVDSLSLTDTTFVLTHHVDGQLTPASVITDVPGSTVTLRFNSGLDVGNYSLKIRDELQDLSGNRLDGEFSRNFPSGDGSQNGEFNASFRLGFLASQPGTLASASLMGRVHPIPPSTNFVPDFCTLQLDTTIFVATIDFPMRLQEDGFAELPNYFSGFAIRFTSILAVDSSGEYGFRISGNGSNLYINGVRVINNDGTLVNAHAVGAQSMILSEGLHSLVVEYFENTPENSDKLGLQLFWEPPGTRGYNIIPDSVLSLPPSGPVAPSITQISPGSAERDTTIQAMLYGSNLDSVASVAFVDFESTGANITATVNTVTSDSVAVTLTIPIDAEGGDHFFTLFDVNGIPLLDSGNNNVCFHVLFTPGNIKPVITTVPITEAVVGSEYNYFIRTYDANNDTVTVSLIQGPTGLTLAADPGQGLLEWTPTVGQEGDHVIIVQIDDGNGGTDGQSFTVTVAPFVPNDPPTITSTPELFAREGDTYTYTVTATDPDADPLTFRLGVSPAFMSIGAASGVLQWIPTAIQAGEQEVIVEVLDGKGGVARQPYTIRVESLNPPNRYPAITSLPAGLALPDQPYIYPVAADDPDGDIIEFALRIAPVGMTIDSQTGEVQWTPDVAQLGNHQVVIAADDQQGAVTIQNYILAVVSTIENLPPEITSTPAGLANPDVLYAYQVNAYDPEGDNLSYSLLTSPAGMQIDGSGFLMWSPTMADLGDHTVELEVEDTQLNAATQLYNLRILEGDLNNNSPKIFSSPATTAIAESLFTYLVEADDPDQDLQSFTLALAPTGMAIDFLSGEIQWTPTPAQVGDHNVEVRASDGQGGIGLQQFTITVVAPGTNLPPFITSTLSNFAVPDILYDFPLTATDANNDPIGFNLLVNPTGMIIDGNDHVVWTPQVAQLGTHDVEIQASDGNGGFADLRFQITVVQDSLPPVVQILLEPERADIGETVRVTVLADDDVGLAQLSLTAAGVPLTLDADNQVTYLAATRGRVTFSADAEDLSGNQSSVTENLAVVDPNDASPPVVSIDTPQDLDVITSITDVIGTAFDENLQSYSLAYAEFRDGDVSPESFVEFASGTESLADTILGTFDPTLLMNGCYIIRLTAEDQNGQRVQTFVQVTVSGEMKVGNFTLAFTDLTLPVSRLPIQIRRIYDSRDKQVGDFGVGWRMSVKSIDLQEDPNRNVTVTHPDGRRVTFSFNLRPTNRFVADVFSALWEPERGVYDQLAMLGDNRVLRDQTPFPFGTLLFFYDRTDIPYDCYEIPGYVLTLKDGTSFTIQKPGIGIIEAGNTGCGSAVNLVEYGQPQLTEVRDLNDNTVVFTDSGIVHSAGKSILWERDSLGRIIRIIDPMGNDLHYSYDSNGDLVTFTNQTEDTTRFTYNIDHGLLDIIDPRGVSGIRSEYNDDGRLIATVDANGNRTEIEHDLANRTEIVQDRLGNPTFIGYNDRGNVVSQTDALGNTTEFLYEDPQNLTLATAEINALGDTTRFVYDAAGNVMAQVNQLGNTTLFSYNPHGQVLSTTDPKGNTTTYTYDSAGNLLTTTDPLGNVMANIYDPAGNLKSATDALGNITSFDYDPFGNLIREVNSLGHAKAFTYNDNNNQITETAIRTTPEGQREIITTFLYDDKNRLVQTIDPLSNSSFTEYNEIGKVAATIDKNGVRTEFSYDLIGNQIRVDYADSTFTETSYDKEGRQQLKTDRNGRITEFQYDVIGRLISTIYPDSTIDSTEYDALGRVKSVTNENGGQTSYTYLAGVQIDGRSSGEQSNVASITDALTNLTMFDYDANLNLTSETDARGNPTHFEYDANNRKIKTTFEDGTFISFVYDGLGRKISETDQGGNVTEFEYDRLNRLTAVIDALGFKTQYTYDEMGNQLTEEDANGNKTEWEYNDVGNVLKRTLPLGMSEIFTYDPNGNVLTKTDFNSQLITSEYDVNNQLSKKIYPDETEITFTYTAEGQIETVTDVRGTTSYSYDLRDRLVEVVNPDGTRLTYGYDSVGNRTAVTTPTDTTNYLFDDGNRLTDVIDLNGDTTSYMYDAVGNITNILYPNGSTATYNFDTLNRLDSMENRKSGGDVISSYTYTLDPAGNRTEVMEIPGRAVEYTYDQLYRLIQEQITDSVLGNQTTAYSYDSVGNRLTKTDAGGTTNYLYDANNRLLLEGTTSYTYDDNGNTLTSSNGPDTTYYSYDFENRLIFAQMPQDEIAYEYDHDGIRVGSTVNSIVTDFLVDKNRNYAQVLEERTSGGLVKVRYVYGHDLISQHANGVSSYYHYDALGSTRALTDSNEIITDTFKYEAFGNLLASTGNTENTHLFTGEQFDTSLDLYYLRARYYAPSLGRFQTMDSWPGSIHEPMSLHKYLYGNANPVNFVDPSGNFATLTGLMVGVAIIGVLVSIPSDHGPFRPVVCSDGREPTLEEKIMVSRIAPRLYAKGFRVTGGKTRAYNCISWSVGQTRPWIWEQVDKDYGNKNGIEEISDFDAFYKKKAGLSPTKIPSEAQVVLYGHGDRPEHAARKYICSDSGYLFFESKLGRAPRVIHLLNDISGFLYGRPIRFYK